MTDYSFHSYPDTETCSRCSSSIQTGWNIEGKVYGPTCGIVILKSLGVEFSNKYGPSALDSNAIQFAVETYITWITAKRKNTFPNPITVKDITHLKRSIGSASWKMIGLVINSINNGTAITFMGSPDDIQTQMKQYDLIKSIYKQETQS